MANTAPGLTLVNNIKQSMQKKQFGLIWAYTVCSGLLVRLFMVGSALDLVCDDSVFYHRLKRKHSDLILVNAVRSDLFFPIIYGNYGIT